MKSTELSAVLKLAKKAVSQTDGKWDANTKLISWFRSDPVAVVEALHAAAVVSERPGGLAHTRLHEAMAALQPIKKEPAHA